MNSIFFNRGTGARKWWWLLAMLVGLGVSMPPTATAFQTTSSKPAAKAQAKKKKKKREAESKQQYITGSHLKQDIKQAGYITTASSPVIVIDRQAIERSGAGSVSEILSRRPGMTR